MKMDNAMPRAGEGVMRYDDPAAPGADLLKLEVQNGRDRAQAGYDALKHRMANDWKTSEQKVPPEQTGGRAGYVQRLSSAWKEGR
jgi:hypothetical protein